MGTLGGALDWSVWLNQIETLVRSGLHSEARAALRRLTKSQIPESIVHDVAEIAFRVESPLLALKIIRPHVNPEFNFRHSASPKALRAYAQALFALGATESAFGLLGQLDPKDDPEILLARAGAHFTQWEYAQAVPILEDFVARFEPGAYRRLVGLINLAAARLAGDCGRHESESIINEVIQAATAENYHLIHGNALELMGQLYLYQGRTQEARTVLLRARSILSHQGAAYMLFVEKWLAVCDLLTEKNLVSGLESLHRVRRRASELGHWETLRDCDLYESLATRNMVLARKVILGTPFVGYRQRAEAILGTKVPYSGELNWYPGVLQNPCGESGAMVVDVFSPGQKEFDLHQQKQLYLLFCALTTDFYRPLNMGRIFEQIFPDEQFNLETSPARVFRTLWRLRQWFKERHLPLSVSMTRGAFRLTTRGDVLVRVIRGGSVAGAEEELMKKLKSQFGDRPFQLRQAAGLLGFSKTKMLKIFSEEIKSGRLQCAGTGRGRVYHFGKAGRSQRLRETGS